MRWQEPSKTTIIYDPVLYVYARDDPIAEIHAYNKNQNMTFKPLKCIIPDEDHQPLQLWQCHSKGLFRIWRSSSQTRIYIFSAFTSRAFDAQPHTHNLALVFPLHHRTHGQTSRYTIRFIWSSRSFANHREQTLSFVTIYYAGYPLLDDQYHSPFPCPKTGSWRPFHQPSARGVSSQDSRTKTPFTNNSFATSLSYPPPAGRKFTTQRHGRPYFPPWAYINRACATYVQNVAIFSSVTNANSKRF